MLCAEKAWFTKDSASILQAFDSHKPITRQRNRGRKKRNMAPAGEAHSMADDGSKASRPCTERLRRCPTPHVVDPDGPNRHPSCPDGVDG